MSFNKINEEGLHIRKLPTIRSEEEVVISGIAGRFPESNNVQQLQENLMKGHNLVTSDDRRWILSPDLPKYGGKINNIEKFDALFFGVHAKQARVMDPACRMLLEHAYEAIIDAGINPRQLRGKRTGVFVGNCQMESEITNLYQEDNINGFGLIGCSRAMLANRVSYWLGVTGPSYVVDAACSSSLCALEHAYRAIHEGYCDSAVVGGANLCLHPSVTLQFAKLDIMSPDGRCKSFDESADGYVRSEAIAAVFLQKAKDAKRVYATVVHGKINSDGFKEEGITYPSEQMQGVLLKELYLECGLSPSIVDYVEAHGTATRVGDLVELNVLDKIFCADRETPLKIGTCKTNLGHAEPASGLISIAKAIGALESGMIPPNLHFKTPRKDIKALVEGRMMVVTEPTPLNGKYIGINSFGYGGANAHVLLKANTKEKVNNGAPNDDLPRLVTVSGRTEEAVSTIIDYLNSKPVDAEYISLLHDVHSENINGHLYRGYTLLPSHGTATNPVKQIQAFSGAKRPVCFILSGVGSQWPGMGEAFLRLPIFTRAINKCNDILKPYGIDIVNIITNKEKTAFNHPIYKFVGITAIQIGLIDILRSLGIEPDYLIGHSLGEVACAYADGCFTVEQAIMSSYFRGLVCCETDHIRGSMVAVGIGFQKLKNICPPDIEIACHNSAENATISGPEESVNRFTTYLRSKNVFVREVECNHTPYHSTYIAKMGPKLLNYIKKIVAKPKLRSSKWLSTSVPIDQWNTSAGQYSSAEYHTNNMLVPVLFEEAIATISKDAIAIEVSPHGLLQAILRRSLPETATNIALSKRGHEDNIQFMLESLGKIFTVGLNPRLANIYPSIEYPVSRGTPMISPLIKWEHSDNWYTMSYKTEQENIPCEHVVEVSLCDPNYNFLTGHLVDGSNIFPFSGYLTLVWEMAAKVYRTLLSELSVIFENIRFLKTTMIPNNKSVSFTVIIQKGTGRFEILRSGAAVVTGQISAKFNPSTEKINAPIPADEDEFMISSDVYTELKLRGYNYTGIFQSIKKSTISASKGHIAWHNNWMVFIDNMIQMQILGEDSRNLVIPTRIKKLVIDVKSHFNQKQDNGSGQEFPVYVNRNYDVITCGGVEIRGLRTRTIKRREEVNNPVVEEYKFISHHDKAEVNLYEIVNYVTQICLENCFDTNIRTVELNEEFDNVATRILLSPLISKALKDVALVKAKIDIISKESRCYNDVLSENISIVDLKEINASSDAVLAIGHHLLTRDRRKNLDLLLSELKKGGFLLIREITKDLNNVSTIVQDANLDIILEKTFREDTFILLKKRETQAQNISIIHVDNNSFEWIEDMQKAMSKAVKINDDNKTYRILFVGQGDFENGLIGFINCLRKEPGGELVRGLIIQDLEAPKFSLENPLYSKQLEKDLVLNVFRKNGKWGSYRYLPIPSPEPQMVRHAWINQTISEDLGSLSWHEGPILPEYDDKHLINIVYSSVNSRDVMLACGKLDIKDITKTTQFHECAIGFEYSGINASGKRIMGIVENRAISNLCIADHDLTWEIPGSWSLEDAATVPWAYGSAYYALYEKGNIKRNDKVLIHEGTEDFGLAAIYLAIQEGCEIFTTVNTPEKRQFILEHFSEIQESHIGVSSDTNFEKMIIQQTNNRGVDIVLNNLDGEKLQASINCLARGGRFLQVGKLDITSDNPLGMECFLRGINFCGVMLDQCLSTESSAEKLKFKTFITEGLQKGVIKPLPRTIFSKNNVEAAFRYMADGKNIGKVLVKVCDEKKQLNEFTLALPRYYCHTNRSYIILGGVGGFGFELANWLVSRGAKYLVLTSRSGIKNSYQRMRMKLWRDFGVRVILIAGKNVTQYEDCQDIVKEATKLAPVDGIFNLMAELNDAGWNNMTATLFEGQFGCKVWATKHFDKLSRTLCPLLRHFVVFSSYSSGKGYPGQTNYGMANSAMERVCEKRVMDGVPALAIQWGAIKDVGIVARMLKNRDDQVIGGTLPQSIISCLQVLDMFLQQKNPVLSSHIVAAEKKVPLFKESKHKNIVNIILNIMGLKDLKGASPNTSFTELGMDSIMSVEIKQTLEQEFKIFLSAEEIRGLNFTKLQEMYAQSHKNKTVLIT